MSRHPNEMIDGEDMDGAAREKKLEAVSSNALFAPRRSDVIRNLHTGEGFTVLEVADTGEPIINTRSGKIRVPWSSYKKHYRNVTAETFRANVKLNRRQSDGNQP